MTTTIGLDWSMNCPAITVYNGVPEEFSFDKCRCFYRSERVPIEWYNIKGFRIEPCQNNEERWNAIAQWLMETIKPFLTENNKAFIEDYSYNSRGRNFHVAENIGVTKHYLWKAGIAVQVVSPSIVKKVGSGMGNATKTGMHRVFKLETGIDLMPIFQPRASEVGSPVGDIVDSYALCKYGVLGMPPSKRRKT